LADAIVEPIVTGRRCEGTDDAVSPLLKMVGLDRASAPPRPARVRNDLPACDAGTEPDQILNVANGEFYSCRTARLGLLQAGEYS